VTPQDLVPLDAILVGASAAALTWALLPRRRSVLPVRRTKAGGRWAEAVLRLYPRPFRDVAVQAGVPVPLFAGLHLGLTLLALLVVLPSGARAIVLPVLAGVSPRLLVRPLARRRMHLIRAEVRRFVRYVHLYAGARQTSVQSVVRDVAGHMRPPFRQELAWLVLRAEETGFVQALSEWEERLGMPEIRRLAAILRVVAMGGEGRMRDLLAVQEEALRPSSLLRVP
jgi:hypothetical protein